MWRWREQVEIKHADFERMVRSFGYAKHVEHVESQALEAASCPNLGEVAYAKRKSHMFARLEHESKAAYARVGLKKLRSREGTTDTLADRVDAWRAAENELVCNAFFPKTRCSLLPLG